LDPLPPPLDPLLEPELPLLLLPPLLLPPLPLPPLLLPPLLLPPLPLLDESLLDELDDDEPLSLLVVLEPPLDDESLDAFASGFVDE
jgi:hypothetical protein